MKGKKGIGLLIAAMGAPPKKAPRGEPPELDHKPRDEGEGYEVSDEEITAASDIADALGFSNVDTTRLAEAICNLVDLHTK